MSLLDDVSIVVTPNGYKAGELYAVIPVPTEGAEEITNGDFATDTDWTKGTGWTISGGSANSDGANSFSSLSQASVLTIGKRYKLIVDINLTSGQLRIQEGGAILETYTTTGANTATYYFIATATNITFKTSVTPFNGSIDNVSVKEYTSADMDVTRATYATRVDEDGLVNYAEVVSDTELVTNGDFATDTDWVKGTGWTISGGSATSDGSGTSFLYQIISNAQTKRFLIEYEVKDYVSGSVSIVLGSAGSDQLTSSSNGVVSGIVLWDGTSDRLNFKSVSLIGSIDNVSVKEVTRDNVPRIDYTGGGCPHILAEPQRTNLVTYSSDFTQWSTIGSPQLTSNYGISPDGTENSTRIEFSTNDRIYISVSASGDIAYSVYLKGVGQVKLRDNDGSNTKDITLTSEWIRYEFIFNDTITNIQMQQAVGTSDLQIWGAQLEAGSYATSYIPTSGSTVTRNQDIFTRDGIGSLINSTEGVLFLEVAALADDGTNRYLSINDGSTSNYIYFRFVSTSNTVLMRTVVATSTINTLQTAISDTTAYNKFAFKWKSGDYAFWINGVEELVDTSATIFGADVLNQINFDFPAASGTFPSKIRQLQVYDTALTDTQLAALTS